MHMNSEIEEQTSFYYQNNIMDAIHFTLHQMSPHHTTNNVTLDYIQKTNLHHRPEQILRKNKRM